MSQSVFSPALIPSCVSPDSRIPESNSFQPLAASPLSLYQQPIRIVLRSNRLRLELNWTGSEINNLWHTPLPVLRSAPQAAECGERACESDWAECRPRWRWFPPRPAELLVWGSEVWNWQSSAVKCEWRSRTGNKCDSLHLRLGFSRIVHCSGEDEDHTVSPSEHRYASKELHAKGDNRPSAKW